MTVNKKAVFQAMMACEIHPMKLDECISFTEAYLQAVKELEPDPEVSGAKKSFTTELPKKADINAATAELPNLDDADIPFALISISLGKRINQLIDNIAELRGLYEKLD